jgi:ATP-binding cassette subfamily B protein
MKYQKADFEKVLKKSFLSFVSPQDLQSIVALAQVVEAEPLQRAPREDQPQSFFLILSGEVTLRQRGSMFEMDRIRYGHSLELKTLLLRAQQWQYEWQCETKCFFLKVPWTAIEVIVQKYPLQLHYLARVTQSVALQRLKRDLLGLNVSRSTVVNLISKMRQEAFADIIPKDITKKTLLTVSSGELVVQVDDGERPFHLKTLSAGDTTLIDWTQTHLRYVPEGVVRVWVVTEDEWAPLAQAADFVSFMSLFGKRPERDQSLDFSERSQVTSIVEQTQSKVVPISKAKGKGKSKKPVPQHNSSDGLFSKLLRPSLLGSVDENRTGTALLIFLMKQAGFNVGHRDIDAKVVEGWSDTTLLAFKDKCKKVGVTTELLDFPVVPSITKRSSVIVHTQTGFCLITYQRKGVWVLSDFSSGVYREISEVRLQTELKSFQCLVVKSISNIFPASKKEFKFRHVARFLRADFSVLAFLALGSFLAFLTDLSVPVFTQYILDQVVTSGQVALLNPLILVYGSLVVIGILIHWFNQKQNIYLTNVLSLRMKAFFQRAIFKLRPNVIHNMGASQLLSRLSDIDALAGFMVNQCFGSGFALIFMIGNLSVLWIYSPKLVALVFALLPFGLIVTFLMRSRIENLKLEEVRTSAKETRLVLEHFSSNDDMRTLKGILPSRWKWDFNASLFARNLISKQKLLAVFQIIQLTGSEGAKMGAFFYAFRLYMNGQFTIGQVIAVVMIVPRVTDPIQGMISTIYQYYSNKILVMRLNDLLPAHQEARVDRSQLIETHFQQSVQFENVTLQYDNENARQIVKNLTFDIRCGEKVAFMGNTGSGKSSIAYLLAGFHQPTFGQIKYDSLKKEQIDQTLFYNKVALVEQEGRLFAGSILENIALGDDHPDLEKAVQCAKAVVMDDDILTRTGGYGFMILPGGMGLSEGQRQRLLIARALYKEPQILILDEATSYLDPISESQVMKNIWELMKDRTVIVFTQRIQITTRVDQVFFLENGQLLEKGSHKELIDSKQRYFDFYLRHLSIG